VTLGSRQTRRKQRARRRRRELKKGADTAIFLVIARTYTSVRDVDWSVLFFGLLAFLVGSVICVVSGGIVLAALLFLSSVVLFVTLLVKELY
jgi:hypothetical protein